MAKSDYLEGEIIKHIFRTGSFQKPTQLNVALYTAAPSDSGGGTEVSGGNYSRAQLNPSDSNWSDVSAGDGETDNLQEIIFPTPNANWGTVTHFAIFDQSSNMLYHGALQNSKSINNGDPAPKFPVNSLVVTES